MLNAAILLVTVALGALLAWPRLARARLWKATVTPLASIIGSGFLVLGPILNASYGALAPLVMAALCGVAYLFGGAIRANIASLDAQGPTPLGRGLDRLASWVLAFAYVVSVAYYLNLLGAFGVRLTAVNDPLHAKLLTSATFVLIAAVGVTRGFGALEWLEQVSVGLKLAIIGGLLVGLGWYFAGTVAGEGLVLNLPRLGPVEAVTLGFGLLVTVQGFETSRYLGEEYPAGTRIRSMRLAQIVSAAIYMVYICLLTFAFETDGMRLDETGIISMMTLVAPILSTLLVIAALSAQFSAAIADTNGSGGLFAELTGGRVSARMGYLGLALVGLALTWSFDVFEIIAYASRAFALYYAVQAAIAAESARRWDAALAAGGYGALAVLALAIAVFGAPVE